MLKRCLFALFAAFFTVIVAMFAAINLAAAQAQCVASWPAWQHFNNTFIRADGRVEDIASPRHATVSEGQAYALFFALVANDRAAFERILTWTENNLAQGDLSAQLPAWWWGQRDDGSWGVLDSNAASDADLWLAYTLGEAGRIWHERRYLALSRLLAQHILDAETTQIPNFGRALLPGPQGFHPDASTWRLNASYAPLQLLRRLARNDARQSAAWSDIADSSAALIDAAAVHGFVPDWSLYVVGKGVVPDEQTQAIGSYDAIRVYLWLGMLSVDDPYVHSLRARLQPFANYVKQSGLPPEKINTATGEIVTAPGPVGFAAAAAPFVALYDDTAAQSLWQRVERELPPATDYYNWVLITFARGFRDGYFRFAGNGDLLRKESVCATR